jgi:hypothetical protein
MMQLDVTIQASKPVDWIMQSEHFQVYMVQRNPDTVQIRFAGGAYLEIPIDCIKNWSLSSDSLVCPTCKGSGSYTTRRGTQLICADCGGRGCSLP